MLRLFSTLFLCCVLVVLFTYGIGCRKEQSVKGLTALQQEIPANFPAPLYKFEDNPLTEEGFQLGKRLFYDTLLSADKEISCGSCHQQIGAFGTFEHDRSHGVNDSHTLRNAPVLFNLAWNSFFHWDGAYTSFTNAAAQPIHGDREMGMNFTKVIDYLQRDDQYREQFRKVFHSAIIQPQMLLKALAQYTGSLVSANSRYDRYKAGTVTFTAQELNGYNIYKANCATCHPEPLFTDGSFRNTGLEVDMELKDYGRVFITGKGSDSLKFKVPTLRNCYISSNYMHDGRYNTLHQVISFYRFGVNQSPTLDPLLTNGITLTNQQATDLFEFLRTLTDSSFINNPRFKQ